VIFVDTSAWLALYDRKDQNHRTAREVAEYLRESRVPLVTTDYIFDETVTIVRRRVGHREAVAFGEALLKSSVVRLVEIDGVLRRRAWDIFVKYGDQRFSYTDCTSFVVMQHMGINRVFGYDGDFEVLGFVLVPQE